MKKRGNRVEEEIKERKIGSTIAHKKRKGQVLFFLGSMLLLFVAYLGIKRQFEKRFQIIKDDFSWVCQVDNIEEIDETVVLSGFAFQLNQDAKEEVFELILCDTETGKGYYPKMQYNSREDVNDYFLCEYDYTKSGFTASISSKKLDLENKVYEVLLRPVGQLKAYSIGVYYANGEMFFVNPKEFIALNIEETDLEKVVQEGILRVYRPDYGIYVYQYEGELYWIAEEEYEFVDDNTLIQFQMNTTQIQNLPQDRLANHWLWSNISFWFQSKELTDWNTGIYRVAKVALPTKYSITHIWTGNYKSAWIWQSDFRPWYVFNEE